MTDDRVRVEIGDGIATVSLNRPEKRNALDLAMFEAIARVGAELADRDDLRAVVLTGAGAAFCSGLDVSAFMAAPEIISRLMEKPAGEHLNLAQQAVWCWTELPVPVIAALHGSVFGGGLQIALGADIRLVHPAASLSIMEIRWGLVPDMGGTRRLRDLMPLDRVKELTLTGRIVDGVEASRLGLATRACEDPLSAAQALARDIAAVSPDAVRAAKCLLDHAWRLDDADGLDLETRLQAALIGRPNQIEAVRAGLEERKPSFRAASVDPGKCLER
jgi:enoyl-CoA hydratase/carnithine racemase